MRLFFIATFLLLSPLLNAEYRYGIKAETTALNFGKISYKGKAVKLEIIGDNKMQIQGDRVLYSTTNIRTSKVKIKGIPNKSIEITPSFGMLYGTKGNLRLESIEVKNNERIVKLDNRGEAKIEIVGTLLLDKKSIGGDYKGDVRLQMRYLDNNDNIDLSNKRAKDYVAIIPTLVSIDTSFPLVELRSLNFGNIEAKINGACNIMLSDNNTMQTNCPNVTDYQTALFSQEMVAGTSFFITISENNKLYPSTGTSSDYLTLKNMKYSKRISGSNVLIEVFGTLHLNKIESSASYSGTYIITVNY